MITLKEIIGNTPLSEIPEDHKKNIEILLERVNLIRREWGEPMRVTSGYRSLKDHYRIYDQKGISRDKVPLKSQHLAGLAVDVYDPDLSLTKWLKENDSERLVKAGLYCEEGNTNWVHFQCNPPRSGKRWFYP